MSTRRQVKFAIAAGAVIGTAGSLISTAAAEYATTRTAENADLPFGSLSIHHPGAQADDPIAYYLPAGRAGAQFEVASRANSVDLLGDLVRGLSDGHAHPRSVAGSAYKRDRQMGTGLWRAQAARSLWRYDGAFARGLLGTLGGRPSV